MFGPEIILKNQARDKIINFYKKDGFDAKKILNEQSYSDIEMEIMQSAGGTFLASKTKKLKTFEEKKWIENQLNFMQKEHVKDHANRIIDMFSGNLIAQTNEVNILKLTYQKDYDNNKNDIDGAEFLPYELGDKIIELNTNYALRIIKSIKRNDANSGLLLVSIIGKIINISINAHQNKNKRKSLEDSGVWNNKIPIYLEFIKQNTLQKIMPLQKKIYKLDLAAKGLAGITKDQFWQELDNMIIQLTSK